MDVIDSIPGGALGGGALAVAVLLAVMATQGTPTERREFNAAIEKGFAAAAAGIGRYLGGRDLAETPRSEATWWRAFRCRMTGIPRPRLPRSVPRFPSHRPHCPGGPPCPRGHRPGASPRRCRVCASGGDGCPVCSS
ncbi:hypothetical protein GCM10010327_70490 [Streptomyces nitrosporeus]|nr:hypothetical protein GCM10010327_70490 [Streptomyces nitrosporeus]